MRRAVSIVFEATLVLVIGFVGCTSSKKIARTEGMEELQRMRSAVQDVNIVVSAGVTRDEYSKRLTDALLKFGDREGGCKQAIAKFPEGEQQSTAGQVCQHLSKAMDAYTYAKGYIGTEPDGFTATVSEKKYAEAKEQFPNMEDLPVVDTPGGYEWYRRRDMVQGLWEVAGQEFQLAQAGIAKLTQM